MGLENYDGIGRYRSTEYGDVIDPAGKLDGREFKDAVELAMPFAITKVPFPVW